MKWIVLRVAAMASAAGVIPALTVLGNAQTASAAPSADLPQQQIAAIAEAGTVYISGSWNGYVQVPSNSGGQWVGLCRRGSHAADSSPAPTRSSQRQAVCAERREGDRATGGQETGLGLPSHRQPEAGSRARHSTPQVTDGAPRETGVARRAVDHQVPGDGPLYVVRTVPSSGKGTSAVERSSNEVRAEDRSRKGGGPAHANRACVTFQSCALPVGRSSWCMRYRPGMLFSGTRSGARKSQPEQNSRGGRHERVRRQR